MKSEDVTECFLSDKQNEYSQREVFWKRPLFRQTFIATGILSSILSAGLGFGTPTVMIPQLRRPDSTIHIDDETASWLYSINGLAAAATALVVPKLMQMQGRKPIMFLLAIPKLASWIFLYFARDGITLILSGICQGINAGGDTTLAILALAEYTEPKYRGSFLMFKSATFGCGILVANAIGTFVSYKYTAVLGMTVCTFFLSTVLTWPESPEWLASKRRFAECRKSFLWLRGRSEDSDAELQTLIGRYSIQNNDEGQSFRELLFSRLFYIPLSLLVALFTLWISCGKMMCSMYALVIIKEITQDSSTAYIGMLIIDAFSVVAMYSGSYVIHKVRRKPMLLTTTLIGTSFLFILAGYIALITFGILTENPIVSITILVLYSVCMSIGPLTMCTAIYAEIIPYVCKPFLTTLSIIYFSLLNSLSLKVAPLLFREIGLSLVFSLYAGLSLLCLLYLYKFLPETKGKTLQEIEDIFANEKETN